MSATLKYWRNATTLIVATRTSLQTKLAVKPMTINSHSFPHNDFSILMLRRSSKSKFMPNAYVYPGGVVENVDFSNEWISIFASKGVDLTDNVFLNQFCSKKPMPLMQQALKTNISNEIGYRLGAIREAFEEAGILFARDNVDTEIIKPYGMVQSLSDKNKAQIVSTWRDKVLDDPANFLDMCRTLAIVPDIWGLAEWSNWLTPTHLRSNQGSSRFDTAFFVCCAEDELDPTNCRQETVMTQFISPSDSLRQVQENKLYLPPPQLYEMSRLSRFSTLESLKEFSSKRALEGVERFFPVRLNVADGVISALAGDDLYPADPDLTGKNDILQGEGTLEERRTIDKNHHRFEIRSLLDGRLLMNINPPLGHIAPLQDFPVSVKKNGF